MPNWACGSVSVSGTRENVKKFAGRFIYKDEVNIKTAEHGRFFARSFIWQKKQHALMEVDIQFRHQEEHTENTCMFSVDFAWSAMSCLMDGYPQKDPNCITLSDACVEDQVSVEIETEEGGMGFEEYIFCDKDGSVSSNCEDMPSFECQSCHSTMSIPSYGDLDDYECCECGECNWKKVEAVAS